MYDTRIFFWFGPAKGLHATSVWLRRLVQIQGVFIAAMVAVLVSPSTFAVEVSPRAFLISKGIHGLAALLFLGHIFWTGIWMWHAWKGGDAHQVHRVALFANVLDVWCTAVASMVIIATGSFQVAYLGYTPLWLWVGVSGFGLSGVIWIVLLIPWQEVMIRQAEAWDSGEETAAPAFHRFLVLWTWWGAVAVVLPVATYLLMITKPF